MPAAVSMAPDIVAAAAAAAAALAFIRDMHRPAPVTSGLGGALLFMAVGLYGGGVLARTDGWRLHLLLPADLYGIAGTALTLAGLYVARFRRAPGLWAVISAVAAVMYGAAAAVGHAPDGDPLGPVLALHIIFILLAAAFLILLGLLGGLYLIKEGALRRDPTGWARRLPKLDTIDRLQLRAMQAGFLLLTIGAMFGVALFAGATSHNARSDALALITGAIWTVLAVLLYRRQWLGWRGHRLALAGGVLALILVLAILMTLGVGVLRHGGL